MKKTEAEVKATDFDKRLRRHWNRFLAEFSIFSNKQKSVFDEIRVQYGEPHRTYHGVRHPVLLLDELQSARRLRPEWFIDIEQDMAIELALWDHDFFYDTQARDNEERSAERTVQHAEYLGFPAGVGRRAGELVLATKHLGNPAELDAQIVVDIDLSPLAAPWADFAQSSQDIREEYAHVSDLDFRRGRRNFLKGMLERPSIYSTDHFFKRYEAGARWNMKRSLRQFAS